MWSLGCLFYSLLYSKLPFDGQSTLPILQGRYVQPASPQFPSTFTKLLSSMLTVDGAARADSFKVLEAVCRLRGTAIDPELRVIGNQLRSQRENDFACRIDKFSCDGSQSSLVAMRSPETGLGNENRTPVAPLSALAECVVPVVGQQSGFSTPFDAGDEDEWADFESAGDPGVTNETKNSLLQLSDSVSPAQLQSGAGSSSVMSSVNMAMQQVTLGTASFPNHGSLIGECSAGQRDAAKAVEQSHEMTTSEAHIAAPANKKNEVVDRKRVVLTDDLFADLLPGNFK